MSNISLQNLDNYKSDYTHSTSEIFAKYKGLITEYFIQCIDNIYIKNTEYYKYILIKGVETLTHVFKLLLLYTKNLSLAYVHCQKSLYYYVEFICQIGDDTHSFLQLNTKDASLFVYKKTIFDINNEYRKEFASVKNSCAITTNIDLLIKIYKNFVSMVLFDFTFTPENKLTFIEHSSNCCGKLSQNLLNLSLNIAEDDYTEQLKLFNKFSDLMSSTNNRKLAYYIIFSKKLLKKKNSLAKLESKFLSQEHDEKFANLSPTKYINWLFH